LQDHCLKTRILPAFVIESSQQGVEDTFGHAQQGNLVLCRGQGSSGSQKQMPGSAAGMFCWRRFRSVYCQPCNIPPSLAFHLFNAIGLTRVAHSCDHGEAFADSADCVNQGLLLRVGLGIISQDEVQFSGRWPMEDSQMTPR